MRLFSICCIVILCIYIPCTNATVNKIIAVVNGEIITQLDLQAETAPEILREELDYKKKTDAEKIQQIEKYILDGMIGSLLLKQEAERLKLVVSKEEVENEYQQIITRNQLTPEEFKQHLALQQLTEEEFKEKIRNGIIRSRLIGAMVGRKVVVTKQEIQDFYTKNYEKFQNNNQLEIAIIVYPSEIEAVNWSKKIASKEVSFADAVEKISVGPQSNNGGKLGSIDIEDINPEWGQYLLTMQPGEVTPIIDMDGLKGQLQLLDVVQGEPQSIEDATPYIEKVLREPKTEERFKEYTNQLRKRAVIEIRN